MMLHPEMRAALIRAASAMGIVESIWLLQFGTSCNRDSICAIVVGFEIR